jgi:hypothetical protein
MPTFDAEERFYSQHRRLSPQDKKLFRDARARFIEILQQCEAQGLKGVPRFPKSLGIKPLVGKPSVMEFTWADDGRCTWRYEAPRKPGMYHVVWRLIGTHAIYEEEMHRRD